MTTTNDAWDEASDAREAAIKEVVEAWHAREAAIRLNLPDCYHFHASETLDEAIRALFDADMAYWEAFGGEDGCVSGCDSPTCSDLPPEDVFPGLVLTLGERQAFRDELKRREVSGEADPDGECVCCVLAAVLSQSRLIELHDAKEKAVANRDQGA